MARSTLDGPAREDLTDGTRWGWRQARHARFDAEPGRRSLWALAVVAVVYLLAQFAVLSPRTFVGADESLYYSQFARDMPAGYMGAPRAWGVPLLGAPVTLLTDSIIALRLYLGVLSSVGLFLAFWPWHRLRPGPLAPIAALLFCGLWMSLFYGPELMPNLPGALCAVAAVGLFLLALERPRAVRPLAGLGAVVAVMSLLRPTESLPVVAPLLAAAVVWRPWRPWRRPGPAVAVVAGTSVGWVAWSVEAWVRFGGLPSRLARNDYINDVGWHLSVVRHVEAFGSGTQLCNGAMPSCGQITPQAVLVWAAIPMLVGLGLWTARRAAHAPALLLATVVGVSSMLPYLFYTVLANPRFLMVGYALLALPAAQGLAWLATRHRAATVVVAGVLMVYLAGQFSVARAEGIEASRSRAKFVQVGHRLERLGLREPCMVHGTGSWQVAVATRCGSLGDRLLRKVHPEPARIRQILDAEAARGTWVAIVLPARQRPAGDPLTHGLTPRPLGGKTSRTVYLIGPDTSSAQ